MQPKVFLGGAALALLSACATESDPVVENRKFLTPSEKAVNVVFTSKEQAEAVIGFRSTTVIAGTREADTSGSRTRNSTLDRVKADCKIVGDGYSATLVTPSFVNMPSFGPDTKPVKMTCTYDGNSKTQEYKAVNLSAGSRDSATLAVGIVLCPICGVAAAVANNDDKAGDAYGFDLMELEFD